MPSRRQLLAGLGSAASVTLAGCTTGEADGAGEDDLTEKWRTNVGPASAQAVVSGGTLFVPVSSDVLALDRETGERRWSVNAVVDAADRPSDAVTPAVDEYTLYVTGSDEIVRAITIAEQSVWWEFEMESEGYAAPVLAGSRLYVAGGEYVYCLDADTGEAEWSRRLFGAVTGLAREGELLVATTAAGEVYALDTTGGRGEWRASVPGGIETAPAVSGQRVAVGCRDFAVYGFDTAGRRAWSAELDNVGGVAATHETVYASEKTETTALDRETGERRWSVDHGGVYRYGNSPPALEGDTVYVGGDGVHAVDPDSGPLGLQFDRVRSERSLGGTVGHVSVDPDGTALYAGVERSRGPYEYVALEVRRA